MADNTPQNPGDIPEVSNISAKLESKELIAALKERLRLEGDYRDLLKDSIRELNNSIKLIDRTNSSLETMNRSSINLKDINSDIRKFKQDQYLAEQKVLELSIRSGKSAQELNNTTQSYNKLIEDKLKKESDTRKQISEIEKIKSKTSKDDLKNADDYVKRLDFEKQLIEQVEKARSEGNKKLQDAAISKLKSNAKEIQDLKAIMSEESKIYAKKMQAIDASEADLDKINQKIKAQGSSLSEEQLAYIETKKRIDLTQKEIDKSQQKYALEKKISNSMGLTGTIMQNFAQKFGIGKNAYEAMVEQSRKMEEKERQRLDIQSKINELKKSSAPEAANQLKLLESQQKALGPMQSGTSKYFSMLGAGGKAMAQYVKSIPGPVMFAAAAVGIYKLAEAGLSAAGAAAKAAGNFIAGLSKHASTLTRDLVSPITGLIGSIPLVGGLLSGVIDGFAAIVDLVIGVDDHVVKLGRSIGLGANEARTLGYRYADVAQRAEGTRNAALMTKEQLIESNVELAKMLGINRGITTQMAQTNIILRDRLGLDEQSRKYTAETALISGQSQEEIAKFTMGSLENLRKQTGISYNYQDMLRKASGYSGILGLQFAKYPNQLMSSLTRITAMGFELQKLNGMADGFLDFESSITKEFEAQLITGKELNLNSLRQAALTNDYETMAVEITKIAGKTNDFLKMNRIEQQSIAAAANMSVDEMADYLRQQEKSNAIARVFGKITGEQLQEKLRHMRDVKGTIEETQLVAELGAEQFNKMMDKSMAEDFEAVINKVKSAIVSLFANPEFVAFLNRGFKWLSDPENIKMALEWIQDKTAKFIELAGKGLNMVAKIVATILDGLDYLAFGQIPNDFIDNIRDIGKLAQHEAEQMAIGVRNVGLKEADKAKTDFSKTLDDFAKERKQREEQSFKESIKPTTTATEGSFYGNKNVGKAGSFTPGMSTRAEGGIFNKPTLIPSISGHPNLVAEAGEPEVISPLSALPPLLYPLMDQYIKQAIDLSSAFANSQIKSMANQREPTVIERPTAPVNEERSINLNSRVVVQVDERVIGSVTAESFEKYSTVKTDRRTGLIG